MSYKESQASMDSYCKARDIGQNMSWKESQASFDSYGEGNLSVNVYDTCRGKRSVLFSLMLCCAFPYRGLLPC